MSKNHRKIDMLDQKFGKLLVIKEDGRTNDGKIKWLCLCDCGKEHSVNGKHLRAGKIKSCGCTSYNTTHGMSYSQVYRHWTNMTNRCTNPKNSRWDIYGGRGITICDLWLQFENFYADMGDPPENYTLDRIDCNGNYCPENCRWASQKTLESLGKRARYFAERFMGQDQ